MKPSSSWEIVRHRVAICGQVVDLQGKGIEGAEVTLVSMPDALAVRVSAVACLTDRHQGDPRKSFNCAVTKRNGRFFFLDLPDGRYTLRAVDARTKLQDQKDTVVSSDGSGNIKMGWLNLRPSKPS